MTTPALRWDPPGPGSWMLVADHYPRPITASMEAFMPVWSSATTAYMNELGLPIKSATMATVNGLPYVSVSAGGGGKSTPPAWVLKLAVKVVPSLRRSQRTLERTFAERRWRAGITRWFESERPMAMERMLDLARVDAFGLGDAALADHIETTTDLLLASARQHIAMHGLDTIPPGLFVVSAMEWGLGRDEALGLLRGASPASTGASPELDKLRSAVAGRPASTLDELKRLGPDVAGALEEFLLHHGWRVIDGYDIDSTCLAEAPHVVTALATAPPARASEDAQRAVAAARAKVPAAYRDEFDALLEDGRRAYGVRDDNSAILISWPVGLARRAMLAGGRALHSRGALDEPALALEATPAELAGALRGSGPAALDPAALRSRRERRFSIRAADAPRTLGPPEAPPPTGMPGALGKIMRIFEVYDFGGNVATEPFSGTGIGAQPYTGRARLVRGGDTAGAEFRPGDVLVAPMTSPSYNLLLSLAGALITEEGGVFSHAGIMARELELPAVLGVAGATRHIADGDLVTVDPATGRVTVHRDAIAR